jgi:hypothetical protein
VCQVRIGSFTLLGPAVQIYAATQPLDAELGVVDKEVHTYWQRSAHGFCR